jgi:type IV pilus assembly protein PilC
MTTFAYSGRTRGGETVTGERIADSADAAVAALRRDQILVTRIAKSKTSTPKPPKGKKVPSKNLAIFTRQFSVMIDAGLPLVQCLDILGKQEPHKGFAAAILGVREDVEAGASLADAMKKHPKTFDTLYANMIAAGEAGGILDTILKRLAVYIEKSVKLKNDVRSAMIYPVAVVVIAVLIVGVILWKVIPTFAQLFAGLGAELPLPTRVVIGLSNGLVSWGWLVILITGSALWALKRFYATAGGRVTIDAIVLKLPVLGGIVRKVSVARFCRTLSTLMSSGVPILDGLDITARTAGNAIVENAIQKTRAGIERGETIAAPLKETNVFPSMVVQMINVGETTGALDAMLSKIADFYEEEVDTAVAGMLTLLEPIMIAFLGVVVGGIVIAMYLPIFDLISKLS